MLVVSKLLRVPSHYLSMGRVDDSTAAAVVSAADVAVVVIVVVVVFVVFSSFIFFLPLGIFFNRKSVCCCVDWNSIFRNEFLIPTNRRENRGRKISFIPGRVGSIAGKWRDASHSLEKVCGAIARKGDRCYSLVRGGVWSHSWQAERC